jgi:hypothetical protein
MKYRIRTNGEKFTPEEMVKQKNFEHFLQAYKKQALLSTAGKIGFGIAALGVVASIILLSVNTNTTTTNTDVTEKKVNYVSPPLKGFDTPYDSFVVDASKGGELHYKTGSVLKVPPYAFLGKDGRPVNGKVTLRYREFHDIADIFLSGIPMTYDSAGTHYHFESAGMMELLAFQGNGSLNANPDAKINVNLSSKQPGDYFNVYYLDTNKKNWDFVQRDTAGVHPDKNVVKQLNDMLRTRTPEQVNKQLKKDLFVLDKQTGNLEKTKPIFPELADKDRFKIKLDVKADEFPEMTAYEAVVFQIAPEEMNFKPEYSKVTWDQVSVGRWAEKNGYELTFSKGKEKHTFLCRPVVEQKDLPDAKNIFGRLQEKYETLLADHRKKVKEKQLQLELVHKLLKDKNDNLNDSMSTAGMMNDTMFQMQSSIMRGFEVAKFGFWNCDCPTALPKGMIVNASFVDSTGKALKFEDVFLVEKGKNALFTYHSYAFKEFRYDPSKQNMIWAVASGNKLAFFSVQAFRKLKANKENTEFTLKLIDKKFRNTEDVKEFMKI